MCNFCGTLHPRLDADHPVAGEWTVRILDRQGAQQFMLNHEADYFPCEVNAHKLQGWLKAHPGACGSERNFEIAYRVLSAENELLQRPAPPEEPPSEPIRTPIIFIPDSRQPDTLAEYADKKFDTDIQRKRRDEQLRQEYLATLRSKTDWVIE